MTDHGYLILDTLRLRAIQRAEEAHGEPYEGFRVLPKETAATRVRKQLAAATALWLLAVLPADAQIKPVGTFAIESCHARPVWSSFAMLPDWGDFDAAAACAKTSGLRWVLALYGGSRYDPVGPHVTAVKQRADAAGLTPYLLGIVYHEEWYEYALTPGALPITGLTPENPAHVPTIVRLVHWWVGQQHETIRRIWPGLRRVWLTGLVNDDLRHGPLLWRPVPHGVDVIAIEAYAPTGLSWDQTAGLYIRHALATRSEPFVIIAQGFRVDGDPLWGTGPTDEVVDGFAEALRHPKVWGAWMFTWGDRPWAGITGLASLPHWRQRYEQALGLR